MLLTFLLQQYITVKGIAEILLKVALNTKNQSISKWYVAEMIEFDEEDRKYHISFMDGSSKSFRWPEKDHGMRYSVFTRQSR